MQFLSEDDINALPIPPLPMNSFSIEDRIVLPSSLPSETKIEIELNGVKTEIMCATFDSKILIFITQINKIGTFIKAWADSKADGGKIYQTSIVLGKRDDPLLTIYARQLIEKISLFSSKSLLLGISLKEEGRSREHFQEIINKVLEIINLG